MSLAQGPEQAVSQTLVRTVSACPDPTSVLEAGAEILGKRGTLLLESADASSGRAGRSLVVVRSALRLAARGRTVQIAALNANGRALLPWASDLLSQRGTVASNETGLEVRFPPFPGGDEEARLAAPGPADVLRAFSSGLRSTEPDPDAKPLVAGVFAYDFIDSFEDLPEPKEDLLGWPDYEFWLPDRLMWIDHDRRTTTTVAHLFQRGTEEAAHGEAIAALGPLAELVSRSPASGTYESASARATPSGDPTVDLDDDAYQDLVKRCKEHITDGDVFQIVPSRTFSAPCPSPMDAYRYLRASNPSPYMFYVHGDEGTLFGASPETAVKVDGRPLRLHVKPIAGTRPRGKTEDGGIDADLDSRFEAELRLDEKEVAEHMMLVDLARNDVARVSTPGSRRVDALLRVERYSHVMHLVSQVSGILREGIDALHAYVATMNMGTLVGAPKVRAAELLRAYEATRRGPYGGAVGYVTSDGRMDTAIIIRAAVEKEGVAHVRAGAGVVHDSVPAAEADETRRKAGAVLDAIAGGSS